IIVTVVIIVLSLALNIVMARYAPNASFYLPFTRFWQLLTGALLAALTTARALREHDAGATALATTERTPWKAHAMSVAGVLLICGAMLAAHVAEGAQVALALPATLGAALFIAAGPRAAFNRSVF